mgnify:CR=1 FL=1
MHPARLTRPLRRLSCFAALLAWSACQGPQGDPGPQGLVGPAGAVGPPGIPGAPGAANVLASAWVTACAADWRSDNDPQYFYLSFEEKAVTPALLDKGVVVAYYRDPKQKNVVLSLPSVTSQVSIGYFMRVADDRGTVNFDLTFARPRLVPIDFDLEFRWLLLPPNPGGRLQAVDWTDYAAVCHLLQVPE